MKISMPKPHHYGFFVDFLFAISAFFSLVFLLFGGYNHTGEGIVRFVNNVNTIKETYALHWGSDDLLVPDDQQDNIMRGFYVGFDRVCVPEKIDNFDTSVIHGLVNPEHIYPYTHCYNMHPMEHNDLKMIVPIYWTLFGFAVAHFLLKRLYCQNTGFRNMISSNKLYIQLITGCVLFAGPLVLFILSSIYWSEFIESDKDRTITENDDVLGSLDTAEVAAINAEMQPYRENELSNGTTWTVLILLIGQLCQAVACVIVYCRSVAHRDSGTNAFVAILFVGDAGFVGDGKFFNTTQGVSTSIGAPVDAAAKNPDTKAKAATAKTATVSVYADRRVANGIRF